MSFNATQRDLSSLDIISESFEFENYFKKYEEEQDLKKEVDHYQKLEQEKKDKVAVMRTEQDASEGEVDLAKLTELKRCELELLETQQKLNEIRKKMEDLETLAEPIIPDAAEILGPTAENTEEKTAEKEGEEKTAENLDETYYEDETIAEMDKAESDVLAEENSESKKSKEGTEEKSEDKDATETTEENADENTMETEESTEKEAANMEVEIPAADEKEDSNEKEESATGEEAEKKEEDEEAEKKESDAIVDVTMEETEKEETEKDAETMEDTEKEATEAVQEEEEEEEDAAVEDAEEVEDEEIEVDEEVEEVEETNEGEDADKEKTGETNEGNSKDVDVINLADDDDVGLLERPNIEETDQSEAADAEKKTADADTAETDDVIDLTLEDDNEEAVIEVKPMDHYRIMFTFSKPVGTRMRSGIIGAKEVSERVQCIVLEVGPSKDNYKALDEKLKDFISENCIGLLKKWTPAETAKHTVARMLTETAQKKEVDHEVHDCPNGCGMEFPWYRLRSHTEYHCELRKKVCRYCGLETVQRDLKKHMLQCPQFPVACPNACEAKKLKRCEVQFHLDTICPLAYVNCEYLDFGCNVQCQRRNLDSHLRTATPDHLNLVKSSYLKLEGQMGKVWSFLDQKFPAAFCKEGEQEADVDLSEENADEAMEDTEEPKETTEEDNQVDLTGENETEEMTVETENQDEVEKD